MRYMIRLAVILAILGTGTVLMGQYAERWLIYPFDTTHVSPSDAQLTTVSERQIAVDGETLVIWTKPPAPGKPVILYFHGNAGNLANRAGRFQHFLKREYGLVAPAYRGSSGSSGFPHEAVLTADALHVYQMLPDLADTLNPKVVVYGESLGTAVALSLFDKLDQTKRAPPNALVLEAPFTSIQAMAHHHYAALAPYADKLHNQWPSIDRAQSITQPLLIIHGTHDALIPIEHGQKILKAAPSPDKRLLTVRGADHTTLWRSDVLPKLWRFIDRTTR